MGLYGSPTTFHNSEKCHEVFSRCSKTMLIVALTGEIGWLPVHYRQMLIVLKMYIKLENNDCSDILTKVYNWSKTIAIGSIRRTGY